MQVEVRVAVVAELEPLVQPTLQQSEPEGVDLTVDLELSFVDEFYRRQAVLAKGRKEVGRDPIHLPVAVPARLSDRKIIDGNRHEPCRLLRVIGPLISGCCDGNDGTGEDETPEDSHASILAKLVEHYEEYRFLCARCVTHRSHTLTSTSPTCTGCRPGPEQWW